MTSNKDTQLIPCRMSVPDFIIKIVDHLTQYEIPNEIEAAIILGSGLGDFTNDLINTTTISYDAIPKMPSSSVQGHAGELIFGTVRGHNVIAFSGRFHYYEGCSFEQTAIPVYIAKALKVDKLIISNAAGAINRSFSVGDLMVIEDVIRNNLAISPRGYPKHKYLPHRYVDEAQKIAADLELATRQGTYIYVTGPNYETKSEIRAFRKMGADAVGMSTAPELFEAARLELKTVAISLISNMAEGITKGKLNHEEVRAAAQSREKDFSKLVQALIEKL